MTTTTTTLLVAFLVLAAVVAVALVIVNRRRQSLRLQKHYGTEYERAVEQHGGQSRAEAELRKREARVAKFKLLPLSADLAARFNQAWKRVQSLFVDDPRGAVAAADKLVQEVMTARGYPMGDFESRASDISVDHPTVVGAYRAARSIAVRGGRGEVDTEELRKALVHYRTLFSELLETRSITAAAQPPRKIAVHS
jgi:hypothetical protein